MNNNKVVYGWFANGIPFYIGIGTVKRSRSKYKRNQHCSNKRAKAERENCFDIRILHENLSWKEACELEQSLISLYGRRDNGTGILTNMTDGGEGRINGKQTEETKERIKNTLTGTIRPQKVRDKISNSRRGMKFSLETCKRLSDSHKGQKVSHSQETRDKISKAKKGKFYGGNFVPVTIEGVMYCSVKDAATEKKVSSQTIINRIKSKNFSGYSYTV